MKYYPLEKLLHICDQSYVNKEYEKRFNSFSTIKFPLFIKNQEIQLFSVITLDMIKKMEDIQKMLSSIKLFESKYDENIFFKYYVKKLFSDELIATNEIEGVSTTRKEIEVALDNLNSKKDVRLKFLVYKYNQLLSDEDVDLNNSSDIRKLYDELLDGEISNNNLPDGKVFRKSQVELVKRDGVQKVLHKGIMPEQSIILHMNQLLNFINDDDKSNMIIKIALTHYYFGYIHPFYDGNGRINRFISSYLISKYENHLLSFKISKVIKDEIKKYDEAFLITNNQLNKGEATFFIEMFIDVLHKAATELVEELNYYDVKLSEFKEKYGNDSNLSKDEYDVLYVIYQAHLCDVQIQKKEIEEVLDKSAYKIKMLLQALNNKDYIDYEKRLKVKYL